MNSMIFQNLTTKDDVQIDLLVRDGKIAAIAPYGNTTFTDETAEIIDATGYVILPGFVDAHSHPDKTVLGRDWFLNDVENIVAARIKNEREMRRTMNLDAYTQAKKLTDLALTKGTLAARNHVDIDTEIGLSGVEAMLRLKEDYKDKMTMQLVAFPQSGLIVRPGTVELMEEALQMGVDLMGGIDPANMDRDPVQSIKTMFRLAEKYDKPIDIHLHEPGDLGAFSMSLICEHTIASGMQGRVTISHAFCLGSPNQKLTDTMLGKLADAKISLTTGGQAYIPDIPPLTKVLDAGLLIAGGNDNVRDMWSPYGTADMAERVQFIAMRNSLRRDEDIKTCLDVCTANGATLLGLESYGIAPGNPADFCLMKARNAVEAMVTLPVDRKVYKNGKLLAEGGVLL